MLGLSALPPGDPALFPPSDEDRIVESIHRGLGLGCEAAGRAGGAGEGGRVYHVTSSRGIVPIDRYNVRASSPCDARQMRGRDARQMCGRDARDRAERARPSRRCGAIGSAT